LKSSVDLNPLRAEIEKLNCKVDGSGALMAFDPCKGIPDLPEISKAVTEIARMRGLTPLHVMANVLPAGCVVGYHRDWLTPSPLQGERPRLERWHLAVTTNPQALWQDEHNPSLHMEEGHWYGPLMYWRLHSVSNLGPTARLHLVVDLDCPEPLGAY
jgi:hypothetical protein